MRSIITILLCLSISFSSYGHARYLVEKSWEFDGKGSEIGEIFFEGFFLLNDSFQNVTILNYSEGLVFMEHDGIIKVLYNGSMGKKGKLEATALVDVFYKPKILSDSAFELKQLPPTNLTRVTQQMLTHAISLADNRSILRTIRNLTEFVHSYITYDFSYVGRILSAEDVYAGRHGVCVEYSHLFISFANAVGLETRYVVGYVIVNKSVAQDHAWVLVKLSDGSWLPVDPTYLEVGSLDNLHVAVGYGADNAAVSDYAISFSNIRFNSTVNVSTIWSNKSTETVVLGNCTFNESEYRVDVHMKNAKNEYAFLFYSFGLPAGYGEKEERLILLSPGEELSFSHYLNSSAFSPDYAYLVPVRITVNGQKLCEDFIVEIGVLNTSASTVSTAELPQRKWYEQTTCLPLAIVILPFIYILFSHKKS
jgi:hypothetical protein